MPEEKDNSMTHAKKRVEMQKDRIGRKVEFRVSCAAIPVFTGPIPLALTTETGIRGKILTGSGEKSVPPAGASNFLPLRKTAQSVDLPG